MIFINGERSDNADHFKWIYISIFNGYKVFFEKFNDISIWVVGFAITGTGILSLKEHSEIPSSRIGLCEILFLITIISGIAYRLMYSWISLYLKRIDDYISYWDVLKIKEKDDYKHVNLKKFIFNNSLSTINKKLNSIDISCVSAISKPRGFNTIDLFIMNHFEKKGIYKQLIEIPDIDDFFKGDEKMGNELTKEIEEFIRKIHRNIITTFLLGGISIISFLCVIIFIVFHNDEAGRILLNLFSSN